MNKQGSSKDLEEIRLHQDALGPSHAPHPGRPTSLNNLTNMLNTRFEQSGRLDDLEETISLHRGALVLFPDHHPDRLISLDNITLVLIPLERSGRLEDMQVAITMH